MAQRRGIYEEITGGITTKMFVNMYKSGESHMKLSRFYIAIKIRRVIGLNPTTHLIILFCKKPIKDYFIASSTATAQATVAPTIGLLPIPISPIIST
jgi:hypothetical protein